MDTGALAGALELVRRTRPSDGFLRLERGDDESFNSLVTGCYYSLSIEEEELFESLTICIMCAHDQRARRRAVLANKDLARLLLNENAFFFFCAGRDTQWAFFQPKR